MALSLYDITVPSFLQTIGSLRGVLTKGLEHAKDKGMNPQALVEARLIEDMHPLLFQVQRVADHSAGAIRDVMKGAFSMPRNEPHDYAGLQKLLADAETNLKALTPDAVNAVEGRPFLFDTGGFKINFTAEAFLLSFSLPNFYFHGVTAYGILRMKGVPIGKRDYIGQMRMTVGQ